MLAIDEDYSDNECMVNFLMYMMNYTAMIMGTVEHNDSDVYVANLADRFVVQPVEMHTRA
jgi:hypothetical protein